MWGMTERCFHRQTNKPPQHTNPLYTYLGRRKPPKDEVEHLSTALPEHGRAGGPVELQKSFESLEHGGHNLKGGGATSVAASVHGGTPLGEELHQRSQELIEKNETEQKG